MTDDTLLRSLGRLARQEGVPEAPAPRPEDESRWEALCRGELDDAEREALRREAERSPVAERRWALYRPLDAAVRGRLGEQVRASLEGHRGEPGGDAVVVPIAGRRPARWRLAMAAASVAAASLLWLLWPASTLPPLPSYTLDLEGGRRAQRAGAAAASGELLAEGRIEIVLRPATAVSGPLAVRAFIARGGAVAPWPLPAEIASSGAVRIAGAVRELLPAEPGAFQLAVAIGRPGRLPEAAEVAARLAAAGGAATSDWTLLSVHLRLLPGPGGR